MAVLTYLHSWVSGLWWWWIGGSIFAEVVDLDEPVVQDSLGAVVGLPRLKWSGELDQSSLWVSSIPHLQEKGTERKRGEERARIFLKIHKLDV